MLKPNLVLKFGGTSLASIDCIRNAAKIAKKFTNKFNIIVVVSAMAKFTNTLVEYNNYFYKVKNSKELDTVLSVGEQISAGLFSLALQELGLQACSLLAWQIPIITNKVHTNAHISDIGIEKINKLIHKGIIPVIAGFQGLNALNNITTLGRGGSDTTAVAIAAAIKAKKCYIYTDVDGIFICDPNLINTTKLIKSINFPELIEITNSGAKVIHCRAVELAYKNNLTLYIKSTFNNKGGTVIQKGEASLEKALVNSIVTSKNEVMFTIKNIPLLGNVDLQILNQLLKEGILIDLINKEIKTNSINLFFVISRDSLELAIKILKNQQNLVKFNNIQYNAEVAKVSIVGLGLQTHPIIMESIFKSIIKLNIKILLISTANLKLTFLINEKELKLLAESLYSCLKPFFDNSATKEQYYDSK